MGRINEYLKGIFSKNNSEDIRNSSEKVINEVEDINSTQDSESFSPTREELLSYRDDCFDYMEQYGMTVNNMENGQTPENYTEQKEEKIDHDKYIYIEAGDELYNDDNEYEIRYTGADKYLIPISDIQNSKLELDTYEPDLLKEVESAEYMIEGIHSHFGREKIQQFTFIHKGEEAPDLNVTFTDNRTHVYNRNHIEELLENNNSEHQISNMNEAKIDTQNDYSNKEESDISSIRMSDMTFNYQKLKDEKIKDFNILNEIDNLNIELKDGTDLKVYNSKEEKEEFNRHTYNYNNSFLNQNYKNASAGAEVINVDKLDITVKDYMNYTFDKNKGLSYPNSIDSHVEKHLQNKIDKRRSKNKDIEL